MKLSLNWLNDFVDLSGISAKEIMNKLTLSTCEIEGFTETYSHLKQVQVAQIISVQKHPQADRLSVCQVKSDTGVINIVCGAPNVRPHMFVALAPVGTMLPLSDTENKGEVKIIEIRKAKIRGIESFGMLCSAQELQLEAIMTGMVNQDIGILDLEKFPIEKKKIEVGYILNHLFPFCDLIFEVDNKSITHRPDLWSHWGFARELSVLFKSPLKQNPLNLKPRRLNLKLPQKKIHIEEEAALAYYGFSISKVKIKASPLWMQARLINIGQRPINNVVDASNYVMFDVGQPTHAFSMGSLQEDTIHVLKNKEELGIQSFTTLDKEKRKLPLESILILDGPAIKKRVIALGGIMGAFSSGVQNTQNDDGIDSKSISQDFFIESACFPRNLIRKTISTLGLRTDAAQRFEKGLDPLQALPALYRVAYFIKQSCSEVEIGKLCGKVSRTPKLKIIRINLKQIRQRLGFTIRLEEIQKILTGLGFIVKWKEKKPEQLGNSNSMQKNKRVKDALDIDFQISVPSYRSNYDVNLPEDIVEELGRIYGYDNIPAKVPSGSLLPSPLPARKLLLREIQEYFAYSAHFSETYNYSFASSSQKDLFKNKNQILLKNPVFEHKNSLRTSLLPGLLEQAVVNQDRFIEVRLFEQGRIYFKKQDIASETQSELPQEENHITLLFMPELTDALKGKPEEKNAELLSHLIGLRQKMETILQRILGKDIQFSYSSSEEIQSKEREEHLLFLHPGSQILFSNSFVGILGSLGMLHPDWETRFLIKRPTLVANINFDSIYRAYQKSQKNRVKGYSSPSIYPNSNFEISLLMHIAEKTDVPLRHIQKMKIEAIQSMRYIKEYQGTPLLSDQKSVSYEISCGKRDATLKSEELQKILDEVVDHLRKKGFALRT